MTVFRELDTVVLAHDLPDLGLCAGDIGAVVQLYPADAVEVEFVTAAGRTQSLLTLRNDDVRAVRDDDLLTVRPAHMPLFFDPILYPCVPPPLEIPATPSKPLCNEPPSPR